MRDRLDEAGRFRRRPRRDRTGEVIRLDTWIERCAHELAAAHIVQPDVLVAGKGCAKIELCDGIEPRCLKKRARTGRCWVIRKILVWLKLGLKNPAAWEGILGESAHPA
ncbi:hypothetical protein ACVWZR_002189 [Bradyrhizobium sp. i1.3.1]